MDSNDYTGYPLKGYGTKSHKIQQMNGTPYEPKVIDHILKNHQMAQRMKNSDLEKAKKKINSIYEQLGVRKITNGDLRRLQNISGFLSSQVKDTFMKIPMHNELTQNMKVLNEAMIEFHNQLLPYKQELAKGL